MSRDICRGLRRGRHRHRLGDLRHRRVSRDRIKRSHRRVRLTKLRHGEGRQAGRKKEKAEAEKAEVADRKSPGGHIVYEAVRQEGLHELDRSNSALAWSGIAAGLAMGFSLLTQAVLQSHLPDTPWRPLLTKFGYAIGFLMVVLGRQQLFTENTLTVILPLLRKPRLAMFGERRAALVDRARL